MSKRHKRRPSEGRTWTTEPDMPHDVDLADDRLVARLCEKFAVDRPTLEQAVERVGPTYMAVSLLLTAPAG